MTTKEDLFLKFIFDDLYKSSTQFITDFLVDFVDVAPPELQSVDIDVVADNLRSCVLNSLKSKEAQKEFLLNAATKFRGIMNNLDRKDFDELKRGIEEDYNEIVNSILNK